MAKKYILISFLTVFVVIILLVAIEIGFTEPNLISSKNTHITEIKVLYGLLSALVVALVLIFGVSGFSRFKPPPDVNEPDRQDNSQSKPKTDNEQSDVETKEVSDASTT